MNDETNGKVGEVRRQFLAACGKFAIVTPPTVGLLLSAAQRNYAVASSGGGSGGGGKPSYNDHGHDSGHDDHGHGH
jgi:hypothetical protein